MHLHLRGKENLVAERSCHSRYYTYNQGMQIPDRWITVLELRRANGERGNPKWLAYDGVVYDVSDCPRWRRDMHERLHFPGQDLSGEMQAAPHKIEVFTRPCVKVIGRLREEQV